jgi:hypothetical protein
MQWSSSPAKLSIRRGTYGRGAYQGLPACRRPCLSHRSRFQQKVCAILDKRVRKLTVDAAGDEALAQCVVSMGEHNLFPKEPKHHFRPKRSDTYMLRRGPSVEIGRGHGESSYGSHLLLAALLLLSVAASMWALVQLARA